MSAGLVPFDFEGRGVRVVEDAAGVPWFVALDVCECLGIRNSRDAVDKLDPDERADVGITDTSSNGVTQRRSVTAVSEPGVYRLCFTSRKPEARRFARWVTHDVLPALRKTGHYSLPGAAPASDEPPLPAAAAHRADLIVAASRSFAALMRTGRDLRLSHTEAALRANDSARRTTGIDLVEELDARDLLTASTPPTAPAAALARAERWPGQTSIEAWLPGRDVVTVRQVIAEALAGDPDDPDLQRRTGQTMTALGWRRHRRRARPGESPAQFLTEYHRSAPR